MEYDSHNKEITQDARYLFKLFEEKVNQKEIKKLLDKFKISERIKWLK